MNDSADCVNWVSKNGDRLELRFDSLHLLLWVLCKLIKPFHLGNCSSGLNSLLIDGSSFPHHSDSFLVILLDLALSFALLYGLDDQGCYGKYDVQTHDDHDAKADFIAVLGDHKRV